MEIVVPNTHSDPPRVTLFGQLEGGRYAAKVMLETSVPNTKCWEREIDRAVVYIEPDSDQLAQIVHALNEHRLEFSRLQDYGSSGGGSSTIPV